MRWLLRLKESEEELIAAAQAGHDSGSADGDDDAKRVTLGVDPGDFLRNRRAPDAEGGGAKGAGEDAQGGRGSLRQEPAALSEAKSLLQRAGMTAHVSALTSNWETLAADGFDSVDALRLAGVEDLVDAGFEQDAAEAVLRALQAEATKPNTEP